jgi:hypothetical protein
LGAATAMKIFGVEILNENSGVSIVAEVTKMQATFVARTRSFAMEMKILFSRGRGAADRGVPWAWSQVPRSAGGCAIHGKSWPPWSGLVRDAWRTGWQFVIRYGQAAGSGSRYLSRAATR